jgi:hypothetical protein
VVVTDVVYNTSCESNGDTVVVLAPSDHLLEAMLNTEHLLAHFGVVDLHHIEDASIEATAA